jgi:uncharacterized protein (DUF1330 family)
MTMRFARLGAAALATALIAAAAAPVAAAPWYVVTEISETLDAEAYGKAVAAAEPIATKSNGGTFVVRSNKAVELDGGAAPSRVIVIRFDSEAQARAWKESPAIRALHAVRVTATRSRSFLVEGVAE